MLTLATGHIDRANEFMATGYGSEAFEALRHLSIEQLGELLLDVPARFGALKAALPEMPSDQFQREWTGSSGHALLRQSCAFVRSMERAYKRLTGRPLEGRTILDYGCGWGRLLRLMYRFSRPEQIYGVDPWDLPIETCRRTRVLGNLAQCDEVPPALPFEGVTFDLVYAFSVFTHLSEKTADAVLRAIRRRIDGKGLLVLTIRPVNYWSVHSHYPPGTSIELMRTRHRELGFAFIPHERPPIDGDVTFGDTSIALDYIERNWTEWQLAGTERNKIDPYQLVLFLRPW